MRDIQSVYWQDVKSIVAEINPHFYQLVNKIDPKSPLYKASYGYGDKIVARGDLGLLKSAPPNMSQELGYSISPIFILLNKSCEIVVDAEERLVPLTYFKPGEIMGGWETFDAYNDIFLGEQRWDIVAGLRSVFMLPKITETTSHKKLCAHFGFYQSPPKCLRSHHRLFKQFTDPKVQARDWKLDVLFLPKSWVDKIMADLNWLSLKYYFLEVAWKQSIRLRQSLYHELLWDSFMVVMSKHKIKASLSTVQTLKHIISICMGSVPGFVPSTSESALPLNLVQSAYQDIYGLKSYIPTIMQPQFVGQGKPIYYSLQFPTSLAPAELYKKDSSTINQLRELIVLIRVFQQEEPKVGQHILKRLKSIKFEYFHTEPDTQYGIQPAADIGVYDERFLKVGQKLLPKENFANHASFAKGLIKITLPD